jgi:hypothetical protein
MPAARSSTSSSDVDTTPAFTWRKSALVVMWSLIWLGVIDIAVNLTFGARASAAQPSALSRYFEYGRSVEGKLMRMVAADPNSGGQMISTGWIDPVELASMPAQAQAGHDLLMAVYGSSFAFNAAHEAAGQDRRITVRGVGGPNAPPSHSYAAYKADAALRKADVAVFGVLSSGVPLMGSMAGLVWLFESPAPYTFPRYRVSATGELLEELPSLRTEADFRRAFGHAEWAAFKDQLRRSDRGYDRFTFEASIADASSIVRLVRRGWVAHRQPYQEGVYDPIGGFNLESEEVRALKMMLLDLKRHTCARGERLVVVLLHTQRQADHLHQALESTLKEARIDYVSTHRLFSANDARNFVPDGHYTQQANAELGAALRALVRDGRGSTGAGGC